MISNIGIDLISISYIESMLRKHGQLFLAKYYTKEEQHEYTRRVKKSEYLAGRFAAKEALYKAVGRDFDPTHLSVLNDDSGRPYFQEKEIRKLNVKISISHYEDYAIAIVLLNEKEEYNEATK